MPPPLMADNSNKVEIKIDADRALEWIKTGAQPTETVRALLKRVGALN